MAKNMSETTEATCPMGQTPQQAGNAMCAIQEHQKAMAEQQAAIVRDQGNVKSQVDEATAAIAKLTEGDKSRSDRDRSPRR